MTDLTTTAARPARGAPSLDAVAVVVNGRSRRAAVEPGTTLLHALRDTFDLTGAKPACETGTCGACTVVLDDQAVYSCLVLAAECDGRAVDTVEGLDATGTPSDLQRAFASCDALQCGFCTPGQLMSLEALRRVDEHPDLAAITTAIQGNLCRCGAYRHILEAAQQAFETRDAS